MSRLALAGAFVVAIFAIGVGCGGDDDEATTTSTAETSATGATGAAGATEFASKANEICEEGNAEIDAAAKEEFGNGQPSADEELAFAEDVVVPNVEEQVALVTALPPPSGQEEVFEEFVDQANADLLEVLDDPSLLTSQGEGEPFAKTNELAIQLGATACAS